MRTACFFFFLFGSEEKPGGWGVILLFATMGKGQACDMNELLKKSK